MPWCCSSTCLTSVGTACMLLLQTHRAFRSEYERRCNDASVSGLRVHELTPQTLYAQKCGGLPKNAPVSVATHYVCGILHNARLHSFLALFVAKRLSCHRALAPRMLVMRSSWSYAKRKRVVANRFLEENKGDIVCSVLLSLLLCLVGCPLGREIRFSGCWGQQKHLYPLR